MKRMQALWLEDQSFALREEVPVPQPSGREALVKVLLAGICSTDLEMLKGYYPFTGVIGHEFVGEVVEAPADPSWVGRRVVGEINAACGACENCRLGRRSHCENRTVLGILHRHGAFADYLTLPIENLHRVPDTIPDRIAVFTEPLAAALEIQEQVQIHPTDRVLVIGAGRLGQLIAYSLALTGCSLQVLARHPHQKELLSRRNIPTLSERELPENKLDVVIEATGSATGFQLARQSVRPRGILVLKSTYKGEAQVNFSSLVVDEITLAGSRCGPFPPALRLLESGLIDPSDLIDACYPLSAGPEAIRFAGQPGVLKVLLQPAYP